MLWFSVIYSLLTVYAVGCYALRAYKKKSRGWRKDVTFCIMMIILIIALNGRIISNL